MKTIIPVEWDGDMPVPRREFDQNAQDLVNSGKYVFCPKSYYKQLVGGKPCGVTIEDIRSLIAQRKQT
jgi:hypothetical protein